MAFTWIPFYKEFAQKLLQYRDNRTPLIDWIYDNLQGYIGHLKDDSDGRRVSDIDPFSVFSIFNRGITDKNRGIICSKLKDGFGIVAPIPEDYNGIPIVNALQSNFMAFEKDRKEGDIERLWNVFVAAVKDEPIKDAYDALKNQFLIKYNLTIGLFWVRPDKYLPLDGNCREYLKDLGIAVSKHQFVVYDEYTKVMKELDVLIASKKYSFSSYAEFSHIAFVKKVENHDGNKKTPGFSGFPSMRYWLLSPGKNAERWDEFFKEGVMGIDFDKLGDLSKFRNDDEIVIALEEKYGGGGSHKNDKCAITDFVTKMQVGDIVIVKQGKRKLLGEGIVKSECYFDEGKDSYRNRRRVEWTLHGEWTVDHDLVTKTLTDISQYEGYPLKLERFMGIEDEQKIAYYWLNASPTIWSVDDHESGEEQTYTAYNEHGNKRRVFSCFESVKAGDLAICYEATPVAKTKAIIEFTQGLHKDDADRLIISFVIKEHLPIGLSMKDLLQYEELSEMTVMKNNQGSLFSITEKEFNTIVKLAKGKENKVIEEVVVSKYTDEDFLSEVFISQTSLTSMKHLLRRKKNIILQGAPGVGKTFCAKRLCYTMMGEKDESRIAFVQFHQNYSYEDFIMGYKPTEGSFELRPGIFYRFCINALNDPDREYFFIIDEINRGNLSKIFGELLMLIEKDYRGEKLTLAYKDEKFFVPKNLYIIGMMNTADRSLAMIDYALRRRFSFYEMHPGFESEGFKKYQFAMNDPHFDRLIEKVENLNRAIAKDESLGSGFELGHSYFCGQKSVDDAWLHQVINYDILPMLQEYWFDNRAEVKKWETELNSIFND